MNQTSFFCGGTSPAVRYAVQHLKKFGFSISLEPNWDTGHLLLDVPSFRDGKLRSGECPDTLLSAFPKDIHIWGGNLQNASLSGFVATDLLKDEQYLIENAAITADCALKIAAPLVQTSWKETSVLIIGWGRIGKCLGKLLRDAGCSPVIAARNPVHRAALRSLGYTAADPAALSSVLGDVQLIFNTAPDSVINASQAELCRNCVKIDLASVKGIDGPDVIWARGLPSIHAPERSGKLIAETIIRLMKEENV